VLEEGEECPRVVQVVSSGFRVSDANRVSVLARLEERLKKPKATIRLVLPVPLGSGYAASAALALAYSTLVAASSGSMGFEEAAREAHIAEVVEGTGLGDVVAIYYGRMLEARTAPGGPGVGRVESFPVDASHVVTASLGFMSTSDMHSSRLEYIERAFAKAYTQFIENPSLDSFLESARMFSIEAGFAGRELAERLDGLVSRGLARGWYVKKKVVVVVPEDGLVGEVAGELKRIVSSSVFIHEVAGSPLVARRAA